MTRYLIKNTGQGFDLGFYRGVNELEAYRAMLVSSGFNETRLMPGMEWDRIPDHISVKEAGK